MGSYKDLIKFIDGGTPSSIIAIVLANTNHMNKGEIIMKNTKFKMMAIALCLTVGFAFAGCNASATETTKEETTTTTTEATTTTTTEETTTEEEDELYGEEVTDVSEDFSMPEMPSPEDFENETVSELAQECIDNEIGIYNITEDMLDYEITEGEYLEGFMGMGGEIHASTSTEDDEASAEDTDFVMIQCYAFSSYDAAVEYYGQYEEAFAEEGLEVETEETDEGLTMSGEVTENGATESVNGFISNDGVFYLEVHVAG